jgi:hypothetical protein
LPHAGAGGEKNDGVEYIARCDSVMAAVCGAGTIRGTGAGPGYNTIGAGLGVGQT